MSKLDDLRAMVEAMTPGEWQIAGPWPAVSIVVDHDPSNEPPDEIATMGTLVSKEQKCGDHRDAAGIAALRNAAPALLAVVEAVDAFLNANDATLAGDRYYIPRAHAVEKLRAARRRLEDLP